MPFSMTRHSSIATTSYSTRESLNRRQHELPSTPTESMCSNGRRRQRSPLNTHKRPASGMTVAQRKTVCRCRDASRRPGNTTARCKLDEFIERARSVYEPCNTLEAKADGFGRCGCWLVLLPRAFLPGWEHCGCWPKWCGIRGDTASAPFAASS